MIQPARTKAQQKLRDRTADMLMALDEDEGIRPEHRLQARRLARLLSGEWTCAGMFCYRRPPEPEKADELVTG
jgi:hypothetical protein